MMRLGEKQKLIVVKKVEFGVYLAEQVEHEKRVLLPAKQVPQGTELGDEIEVFLYRDSKDRIISTNQKKKKKMGEAKPLKIISVQRIGAFLDWGLEKDLFLPYKEQEGKIQEGDEILVRLYIDKSGRLCGSMKEIYEILETDSPYRIGDMVTARVYEFSDNFGTFAAVDDRFSALIPRHEDHSFLRIGDKVEARVTGVKPDGKLDLTLRKKAYQQMDEDALQVLALLEEYDGELPFNDKASPEVIMQETKMSKNAFKRAVGRLYKERKIVITGKSIRKI